MDPDVTKLIVTIDLNDNFDSPIPHLGKISITNGNFTQSLFSSNQFSYYVIVDSPFSDKVTENLFRSKVMITLK